MPKKSDIPPERFNDLLAWLDPSPESQGATYLELRDSLVRIFAWRLCADPEGMADEVFDRICARVAELQREFRGNPRLYCYGVANNLIKEYHKASRLFVPVEDIDIPDQPPSQAENEFAELREECLSGCLQELSESKRDQILSYYSKTKHEKIILRAEMARQLGISIQTLRVRMNRIRRGLETCIERCLEQYRTAE